MDYGTLCRLRATVESISDRTDVTVRFGQWQVDAVGLNRPAISRRAIEVRRVSSKGDVVLVALDRDYAVPIVVVGPTARLDEPPAGFTRHAALLPAAVALPPRVRQLADLLGLGNGIPKATEPVNIAWLDRQVTFDQDGRPVPVQAKPPEMWLEPWRDTAPANTARAAGVNRHGVEPLHETRALSPDRGPTSVTVCPPDWRGSMRVFAQTGADCHFSGCEVMASSPDPRTAMTQALEWAFGKVAACEAAAPAD